MATLVEVTDAAGVKRMVRPVDAKEIEASKVAGATEEEKPEAPSEADLAVDDQSIEPKVSTKAKKAAKK